MALPGIEWRTSETPVDYPPAVAEMEERVTAIRAGTAAELVWLLEHPALYTAGTSARAEELIEPGRLPVFRTGRGGRYTYHGPGQRVIYLMLDLRWRGQDVRCYVHQLEEWIIRVLAHFGINGERRDGRVGIWVAHPSGNEAKIAAVGVRVRQWVTYHGVALNIDPELENYRGIVPCGISDHGVTSLAALGIRATMQNVDTALRSTFGEVFAIAPTCRS
ncbi:MAG: lipoyl(octanoyl) transferase LipB [Alphaproteobacteria bacterium]|nr:lipoyl(octanoyl) transferase LipB [Alphaproteobacteria bacterium]MBV9374755.1 lipoyl(octanoyl) transferase LipB [Alphaproteobacteria bacterium]